MPRLSALQGVTSAPSAMVQLRGPVGTRSSSVPNPVRTAKHTTFIKEALVEAHVACGTKSVDGVPSGDGEEGLDIPEVSLSPVTVLS